MKKSYLMFNITRYVLGSALVLAAFGCNKAVEVPAPITSINSGNVYISDVAAIAVMTDLYAGESRASISSGTSLTSTSYLTELSADNLNLLSGSNPAGLQYYSNSLSNQNGEFWIACYPKIFIVNSVIESVNASTTLTPAVKQQLLGEAKFMRALYYFYLVNFYNDVPLVTSTDYTRNSIITRTNRETVYTQIFSDLRDAQNLLSPNFLDITLLTNSTERLRPSKWSAIALLGRAYLFHGDYQLAVDQATQVINSANFSLSTITNTFLRSSLGNKEAIWQLQPVVSGENTKDAKTFVVPSTGLSQSFPVSVNSELLNSFEPGDLRLSNWVASVTTGAITTYFPYKYKNNTLNTPVTEFNTIFRLAEQYLIRAEATTQIGQTSIAISDLNMIRARAGLPNYTGATDKVSLLAAILRENRIEFFAEWGHRWLDLKRTNTVDVTMHLAAVSKGGVWSSYKQWYPLPLSDLLSDPHLAQNQGY